MELYTYIMLVVFCKVLYANGTFNIQCRTLNNNCFCAPALLGYELQCPNEQSPKVIVTVELKIINIQCVDAVNWTNQNLTLIETNHVNHIGIRNCQFAKNNFAQIMNSFQINNTKLLTLDISAQFGNLTLTTDYFKSFSSLKKLILQNSDMKYVTEDAFKSLNNLIELNLSNNNITLMDNSFKHLTKLKVLQLINNNLSSLPSHLFQNLIELKTLYLNSNKFTVFNNSTFRNLKDLEILELSNNRLKYFPTDIFYNLKNLKKINLSVNKLQSIPENLFTKNVFLDYVSISRNPNLTDLPNYLFSNLTKLEHILLYDCKISQLPSNLFDGLIRLKNLALQRNEIELILGSTFKNLTELRDLDLSYNKIKILSDEIFNSLTRLKALNLESNLLENIKEGYFKNLQQLEVLNLKNNKISLIDVRSFQKNVNLKKIILANNYLSMSMGNILSYNMNLENIDLSSNNITAIDEHFLMKVGLRELDFSYNKISYLEFSNLMTLSFPIKINLKYNNISTIDFNYAETIARNRGHYLHRPITNLNREVYLDGNPISCDCYLYNFSKYFDHSIDPLIPTTVKIIADNLTCANPTELAGILVKELKPSMLVCSPQNLGIEVDCPEKCFCDYRPYDKSLIVNCIETNLTKAPKLNLSTKNYFNQLEVYLQGNFLTSGPTENSGYENVTKLFLSYNNITEISWVPQKIKVLHLNNNNIEHLNDQVLSMLNMSSIINLTLGNNPINCDCSTEKLKTFVIAQLLSKKIHLDIDDIKCKNGEEFLAFTNDYCPPFKDILMGFSIPLSLTIFAAAILMMYWAKGRKDRFKHKAII